MKQNSEKLFRTAIGYLVSLVPTHSRADEHRQFAMSLANIIQFEINSLIAQRELFQFNKTTLFCLHLILIFALSFTQFFNLTKTVVRSVLKLLTLVNLHSSHHSSGPGLLLPLQHYLLPLWFNDEFIINLSSSHAQRWTSEWERWEDRERNGNGTIKVDTMRFYNVLLISVSTLHTTSTCNRSHNSR